MGAVAAWSIWNRTAARLSAGVLEQARVAARSINPERLQILHGGSTDLVSDDYLRLKEQLAGIRMAHRTCRFLYLMGRRSDGTVFFFVDSHPPDSPDYAAPGTVYEEVPGDYLATFESGSEQLVGPVTDRWGVLMTGLVPVCSPETGELLAVLGMDVDIQDWRKEMVSRAVFPISLTLLVLLLTVILILINRTRRAERIQFEQKKKYAADVERALQHVKKLQGVLSICTSCGKVKSNDGCWCGIESYVEAHSGVQFSHRLCDECAGNPDAHQD